VKKAQSHSKLHSRMVEMAGHPDEKKDRKLKQKVKPEALTGRARGGKTEKSGGKGKGTQVNVLVAPRGGQGQAGPSATPQGATPGPAAVLPSRQPVPAAPPAPQAGPAGGLAALQGVKPLGVKRGGSVKRRAAGGAVGKFDAGAESGKGRLEKAAHQRRKGSSFQRAAASRTGNK
jgi:hypothetical protein